MNVYLYFNGIEKVFEGERDRNLKLFKHAIDQRKNTGK